MMWLSVVMMICMTSVIGGISLRPSGSDAGVGVVGDVLEAEFQPYCFLILLTDGATSTNDAIMEVRALRSSCGVAAFQVLAAADDANMTQATLTQAVAQAHQLRRRSWYVTVLVMSDDLSFLATFAEQSLRSRLLVWNTRLLLLSHLPLSQLQHILRSHWTYTMLKAMFIIPDDTLDSQRSVYVYLPYSPRGSQLLRVASWTPTLGLCFIGKASLFPEKFANFHGATVNITALPFAPYWIQIKEEAPNGSIVERLTGTDYLMLRAIADTLNFTTYNIPTNSWDEVALRVEERLSFISPVFHMMLPQRAARYDFSFEYEYAALSFSLTKPGLKPQWQNLYYPLSGEVWVATLVAFVIMSASFTMVSRALMSNKRLEVSQAVLETLGILMEENLSKRLPRSNSGRVLLAGWLIFAFIIGTVYRGNLTAALTLPKYPPRPETLEQLVSYVDRVTMPPHGDEFRRFFLSSNSPVFQKLGQMMDLVPTITDGIKLALQRNNAHLDGRRYQSHLIGQTFTQADGTTRLYLGRQSIIPGISAWPIPHDAPFKPTLNRCMMAVIEAGLYEKWSNDLLDQARLESSHKDQMEQDENMQDEEDFQGSIKAINLVHMQGPVFLFVLGVFLSSIAFSLEFLTIRYTF